MKFSLKESIAILERTPEVLEAYVGGLSEEWLMSNEGAGTWSPYEVVVHLIAAEKTDWMSRIQIVLSESEDKKFEPFDRFAPLEAGIDHSATGILREFRRLREDNIQTLKSLNINQEDLNKKGVHPNFGDVTLQQLIATWTVHDLNHIAQISRVLAKQYHEEVGPWVAFLRILKS